MCEELVGSEYFDGDAVEVNESKKKVTWKSRVRTSLRKYTKSKKKEVVALRAHIYEGDEGILVKRFADAATPGFVFVPRPVAMTGLYYLLQLH